MNGATFILPPELQALIQPPMKVETCNFIGKCMASPQSYESEIRFGKKTMQRISETADRELAAALEKTESTHAANAEALEHNKTMAELLAAIMQVAGIPDTFLAPKPGSRSYMPRKISVEAGYRGDIKRNFVISDGYDMDKYKYNSLSVTYTEYRQKAAGEAERLAQESARAEAIAKAKRKADINLAAIIIRCALPEDIDWNDALEALRKRDKYLDLAIAGQLTRGDWSEGFYRVSDALGRFTIETNQDKDIAADICGCLSGDHDDGRIFRDTTWSYEKLFELVADKQLLADAMAALANARD